MTYKVPTYDLVLGLGTPKIKGKNCETGSSDRSEDGEAEQRRMGSATNRSWPSALRFQRGLPGACTNETPDVKARSLRMLVSQNFVGS